jgi:hypothetical protein
MSQDQSDIKSSFEDVMDDTITKLILFSIENGCFNELNEALIKSNISEHFYISLSKIRENKINFILNERH